ncbi:transcription/translation regulatory transformer protein RfaH [Methylonatrum kenyense]|uniref:transcription/translation regulatory transformer protein RfaH n=1 Tax=Methylonatrum kenyense TaxID=455253 RepID=UPI0020BDAB90|nr:transcription/translation regulatory transformer protein RfaH [Methylonatrum kenyense]
MKRWYAAQCKPLQDERAEFNLAAQGFEVLRPLAKVRKRRRGKVCTVIESLFPRYLFVHLDDVAENWAPIRSTLGVAGLVRFGGRAVAVPGRMIHDIRCRLQGTDCCVDLTGQNTIAPGTKVTIETGAFAGHEAIFHARKGEDRVIVLLNIMQQTQRITLDEAAIAR